MAATPKTGVVMFLGLRSGTVFQKPIYNADVLNTYCRIDSGSGTPGATGGSDFCTFPEDVKIIDAMLVTGTVDTLNLRLMIDYAPTPYIINWASYVNTLPTRSPLNIGISAGRRISFQQIA